MSMYVRKKVAKGHTYYQIVLAWRSGKAVRQQVLCSLGRDDDPAAVLKHRSHLLAQHERDRAELDRLHPAAEPVPGPVAKRRARLRASIGKLRHDVAILQVFLGVPRPHRMIDGTTGWILDTPKPRPT
jgi:hypothetical protein